MGVTYVTPIFEYVGGVSMYKNIRDYVPNSDKYLPDLELVNKYIECFLGINSDILDLRCLNFSLSSRGSGSAGTLYKANTENCSLSYLSF